MRWLSVVLVASTVIAGCGNKKAPVAAAEAAAQAVADATPPPPPPPPVVEEPAEPEPPANNADFQATLDATEQYAQIALDAGMTPSELAIAFVRSRKFVEKNGSVIVGATTMEQLEQNLAPFDHGAAVELDEKVLAKIDEVHMKCRDPCCSL